MRLQIPPRGWIVAVGTAMQESSLINTPGGHDDSIGLFQQRPSQGWGTPAQLHDPQYAATKFAQKLQTINGWQAMPLTEAAQGGRRHRDGRRCRFRDLEQCVSTCPSVSNSGSSPGPRDGCVSGEAVLARAAVWLTAWNGDPVPYLSGGDPSTWFGGYRRDCSGCASMALGLPGPGLTGAQLARAGHSDPEADAQRGRPAH